MGQKKKLRSARFLQDQVDEEVSKRVQDFLSRKKKKDKGEEKENG